MTALADLAGPYGERAAGSYNAASGTEPPSE